MSQSLSELQSTKYFGIYRGLVLNNNDPDQSGKIQVQIMPMFQGVTPADLPWTLPAYPIFEGSGDGIGYFAVPKNGTFIYCFFEDGDIYQPIYFAEAPTLTKGIPVSSALNYPNNKVMQTTSGIIININDGDPSLLVYHPSGAVVAIDKTGNIIATSPQKIETQSTDNTEITSLKNIDLISTENINLNSTKDTVITSTRDTIVNSSAKVTLSSEGDTSVTSHGKVSINSTGIITIAGAAAINVTGDSTVNVTGTIITVSGSVQVAINP